MALGEPQQRMNTAHGSVLPNQRRRASFPGKLHAPSAHPPGMKTRWLQKDDGALGQRSSDVVQFGKMNVAVARAAAVAYKLELKSSSPKRERIPTEPDVSPVGSSDSALTSGEDKKRLNFWAIRL